MCVQRGLNAKTVIECRETCCQCLHGNHGLFSKYGMSSANLILYVSAFLLHLSTHVLYVMLAWFQWMLFGMILWFSPLFAIPVVLGVAKIIWTVNCPSLETEVTSTPTRPVDNVVITTKGLQDRNNNKGKLILYLIKSR